MVVNENLCIYWGSVLQKWEALLQGIFCLEFSNYKLLRWDALSVSKSFVI